MPIVIFSEILRDYSILIWKLKSYIPGMKSGSHVRLYLLEIRDNKNNLIKRFKPFKDLSLKIIYTYKYYLIFPEDLAYELNLHRGYKILAVITSYEGKPLLPFELKPLDRKAEEAIKSFPPIEANLLTLCFEHDILNKSFSYLFDAYFRLEENDIEGARVSLRNSLEVLRRELLPVLEVREESESFRENLESLISKLRGFLNYGGPHPGPAPKITTEMVISMTIELAKYLAKSLVAGIISIKSSFSSGRLV
ncbi:MAG: hypothetical protein LM590_13975 [Thermofilum sp.]|nr:hypothetical protein [Thermofilum sp.]